MPQMSHIHGFTRSWPSLADVPALYPDARNRINRGPLVYRAGGTHPLVGQPDTADRVPLLAVGSNGYPRQLADKFADFPDADLQGVALVPCILRGYDVAWCPMIGRKGYAPVTLAERPDAVCLTWLQWLTRKQLEIIAATEGRRYALVGGPALAATAEIPPQIRRPEALYAWWFDSVLIESGASAWFDVYRRRSAVIEDVSGTAPNPAPEGWISIPRGSNSGPIWDEMLTIIC